MPHSIILPASLSTASLAEFERALTVAPKTSGVWVLSGSPGVFCTGMDLASLSTEGDVDGSLAAYARCLDAIRRAPRPTIAVIDGQAAGGGVGIAAACDSVLATRRSTFALPEAVFGLLPAIIMPVVVERMTHQRARRRALSGGSRDAVAAARAGLCDAVVPSAAELGDAVAVRVKAMRRVDALRVVGLRKWMLELPHLSWPAQLAHGATITSELLRDKGTREAIRLFFEDGTPPWASRELPEEHHA